MQDFWNRKQTNIRRVEFFMGHLTDGLSYFEPHDPGEAIRAVERIIHPLPVV